jgi:hypothetical protein
MEEIIEIVEWAERTAEKLVKPFVGPVLLACAGAICKF